MFADAPQAGTSGDPVSEFAAGIADGLGALVLAVDPHVVVVSSSFPDAASRLTAALREQLVGRSLFLPDIRTSSLGAAAPSLGALAVSSAAIREKFFPEEG